MSETRHRPPSPDAAPGGESPPRKVGVYDRARERARSGGVGTGVMVAVAAIAVLIILWIILA